MLTGREPTRRFLPRRAFEKLSFFILSDFNQLAFIMKLKISVLVLSVFVCLVCGDDPHVKITETDPPLDKVAKTIIQKKTKDVQLTCTVENKPKKSEVQWVMQTASNEVQISTATRSYDAYKWSIDKPTSTAWRLRIQNVEASDEGRYICKVSVSMGNYAVDQRDLSVIELPQISDLLTSNDMTKSEGDTATFECYANGRPTPVVKWTRLAGELLPNGGTEFIGNIFEINYVKWDHAGVYKCTAENSAGKDEKLIRLTVNFHPRVVGSNPLLRQKPGYPKRLECSIKGYPQPIPQAINWVHDNRPVISDGNRYVIRNIAGAYNKISSSLIINPVQEEDFGEYICKAENDKGSGAGTIRLAPSEVPTLTDGYNFGAASTLTLSMASVFMMATVWLLQRLEFQH